MVVFLASVIAFAQFSKPINTQCIEDVYVLDDVSQRMTVTIAQRG